MNIQIYCEKIKSSKLYKEAQNEYIKRLGRFSKIEILPINKFKSAQNVSIYITTTDKDYALSSEELSNLIESDMNRSINIKFLLLSNDNSLDKFLLENPEIKTNNICLLTSPSSEELQITLLLEQIYRIFKIMRNETYHK